jgi:hypothetical protein
VLTIYGFNQPTYEQSGVAPSDAQALREVATYLNALQAMNPDVHVRIVGEGYAEPN